MWHERRRRLTVANDVKHLGLGISNASRLSGLTRVTIYKGLKEIESGELTEIRIRKRVGGRKLITETNPKLAKELESMIEPHTIGDPISPLRWTSNHRTIFMENGIIILTKHNIVYVI